jgi:CRISPR-associated protein Csb1
MSETTMKGTTMSESKISIDKFDSWLQDDGPAALVFHRLLLPVEGKGAWIFPPTFAKSESSEDEEEGNGGEYQIDTLPDDPRHNVCLIDSVGSQANRMEPIFKTQPYTALVPQRLIQMKEGDIVNLLDVGHRAADAAIRFSKTLGPQMWTAFDLMKRKRDCSALARLAPTSLVFGVWDSRATGVKIQRVVRSIIRAYNVMEAKRRATYQSAYDYTTNELISSEHDKGTGKTNPLSQEGFKYALSPKSHGGVQVMGDIQQEAIINLVALRTLSADLNLKRYLLGLALVALSYRDQKCFNLREGCLLRAASKEEFDGKWKSVNFDSTENSEVIPHKIALAYAQAAVQSITFDTQEPDNFDKETAGAWLTIEKKKRKTLAKTKHPAKAVADEAAAALKKRDKANKPEPAATGETTQ